MFQHLHLNLDQRAVLVRNGVAVRALGPGRYTADVVLRARPLSGGPPVVVRAQRAFSIDSTQVKRVFSTAPPTAEPATGSSWTTVGAAAGGAAAALAIAGLAVLLLRRRAPQPTT